MNIKAFFTFVIIVSLLSIPFAHAIEPVDKDLIPEARKVLNYLESMYGKKSLSGISGTKNAEAVYEETGKYPAIIALDLSGWNTPTWGKRNPAEWVKKTYTHEFIISRDELPD